MSKTLRAMALLILASSLGACGGGGGGGGTAQTYPLRAALDRLTRTGSEVTWNAIGTGAPATRNADGDCTGTLIERNLPASATTFGGLPALSVTVTAALTFINCTPAAVNASEISYYSIDYLPLAVDVTGGNFGVYLTPPVIPATVKVGDRGELGTLTFQVSNVDTTYAGRADRTYIIEADTATSAIANSVSKVYDSNNNLTSISQVRYRIDVQGNLTPVSQTIEFGLTGNPLVVFR